jgi:23S rRNA pseudouridine1911/1915/1917 synthase
VRAADLLVDNSGSLDDLRGRARSLVSVVRGLLDSRTARTMEGLRRIFDNPDINDQTD